MISNNFQFFVLHYQLSTISYLNEFIVIPG